MVLTNDAAIIRRHDDRDLHVKSQLRALQLTLRSLGIFTRQRKFGVDEELRRLTSQADVEAEDGGSPVPPAA